MTARLTILCGPARSGKTERLLARYRQALRRPPGSSLWLAPTWRAAAEVRDRLLDGTLPGCFTPGVMTFAKFAQAVLHAARVPVRRVSRLMKRELVRQIIDQQSARGRLKHFQSIAKTSGLTDLICEFIGELKRLEIWPEHFHDACAARGVADKDVELFEIYDLYQHALREHGLFDAEGAFWSARDVLAKGEGRGERGERNDECRMMNDESTAGIHHSSFNIHHSLVVADGFTDFTRTQHEILDILADRAEETFVSLPLEPQPRRADLFAKPLKTLDQLCRRHPEAAVEELGRPTDPLWPAMAHLERTLFTNPRVLGARAEGGGRRAEEEETTRLPSPACGRGAGGEGGRTVVQDALTLTLSQSERGPSAFPSPSALRIEILAAASQLGEMQMIGGRIKRLLADGQARPGEIAVVFRSLEPIAELVHEVFGQLGIPVAVESGQALNRSPVLRALVTLLQLDLDDWPFDRLLAVLGSNYFQPDWPEWACAGGVERTIRRLQVPRGRGLLLKQFSVVGGDSSRRSASGDASYKERTLAVVKRLARALDALPQRATLPEWATAWRHLARETGLLGAMDGKSEIRNPKSEIPSPPSLVSSDHRAWGRLEAALAEADTLAAWLRQRPPELDRRAALEALLDVLGGDRLGHAGDESGQVRVLGAESVRSLRIPHLFLAGLSEKAFPPPQREDRLYSEAEYLRLIDAGLPLVDRGQRTREEMLLFYEAVTRAGKRLYLSYPALDAAAQPLLPSPLLGEVEQAFGPGVLPRTERKDLSPIPQDDEPLCQSEFRVKAIATALDGNVALLAGLMQGDEGRAEGGGRRAEEKEVEGEQSAVGSKSTINSPPSALRPSPSASPISPLPSPLSSTLSAGLELIDLRQDRNRFGPAEGVLQGTAAHYYLATAFHPQHVFAATDLERYASCPFRFLMERVLAIKPIEDLALEFDVLHRGRVVHDVLATFHRRVNQRLGRPASPLELDKLDAAEFDSLLAAAIQDSLPAEPANPVQAALREVDRRLVVEWLSQYREQLRAIRCAVERLPDDDGGRVVRGLLRPRRRSAPFHR